MGLIGKILAAKLVAKLTERLDRAQTDPPPKVEHIPARRPRPVAARGSVLDRAGRLYQRNPKLVASVGAAALALIAAGLSRRAPDSASARSAAAASLGDTRRSSPGQRSPR